MVIEDRTIEPEKIKEFYSDGRYLFEITDILDEGNGSKDKKVFKGRFASDLNPTGAPGKCLLDKMYCLKTVKLKFPLSNFHHPQSRHYWDFFDFEGSNIREILARNNGTVELNDAIKDGRLNVFNNNGGKTSDTYNCMIVEPLYDEFKVDDFKTPAEKIDCLRQIISGLKQLIGFNITNGAHVIAHRDLKFLNVMVEKTPEGKKIIRLIDFPSVKTTNDVLTPKLLDSTTEGAFSKSNVTPETVEPYGNITTKNDVFVLGCMLLEIFEVCSNGVTCNPMLMLHDIAGINIRKPEEYASFYQEMEAQYPFTGKTGVPGWLESYLGGHNIKFEWDVIDTSIRESVKVLFREATVIEQNERLSLDLFDKKLEELEKLARRITVSSAESQKKTDPSSPENVVFIVDTRNLDVYKDLYCSKIQEIMNKYHGSHGLISQAYIWLPDDVEKLTEFQYERDSLVNEYPDDLLSQMEYWVEARPQYSGLVKSNLKALLYKVARAIKRYNYCKDVYILTDIPPSDRNMLDRKFVVKDPDGGTRLEALSLRDITDGLNLYVYTFSESHESWYTTVLFNENSQSQIKPPVSDACDDVKPNKEQAETTTKLSLADRLVFGNVNAKKRGINRIK